MGPFVVIPAVVVKVVPGAEPQEVDHLMQADAQRAPLAVEVEHVEGMLLQKARAHGVQRDAALQIIEKQARIRLKGLGEGRLHLGAVGLPVGGVGLGLAGQLRLKLLVHALQGVGDVHFAIRRGKGRHARLVQLGVEVVDGIRPEGRFVLRLEEEDAVDGIAKAGIGVADIQWQTPFMGTRWSAVRPGRHHGAGVGVVRSFISSPGTQVIRKQLT